MNELLGKTAIFFREDFIGWEYTYDYDIKVYVDLSGEIYDYSGCGFETAEKLINTAKFAN